MASSSSRLILASLLLFLLLALDHHAEAVRPQMIGRSLLGGLGSDCGGLCGVRCSKSSRPNLCKRACGTCCARCSCVPPGTYGNYHACPCYATLTTHGGRRKCP